MDYNTYPIRFVNIGLDLRDSPDTVQQGNWTQLTNIRSTQEGQIQIREGTQLLIAIDSAIGALPAGVNSIKRLDPSTLLSGVGNYLYRNGNPYPTSTYDGNPLSIVPCTPASQAGVWGYIGDANAMRKVNNAGLDYKWGVTAPVNGATFNTNGPGNLSSTVSGAIVYDYRYTYGSSVTGAQSNGSPIQNGISANSNSVGVGVTASSDPQVNQILIYRRGGVIPTTWNLTLTVPNISGTYTDNNSDSLLTAATTLPVNSSGVPIEGHWSVPFTSVDANGNTLYGVPMPYCWGPFLGKYIFGCGAPNQQSTVFWTNPQLPDTSDVGNNVLVCSPNEPLIGGLIFNSNPYVFSRNNIYLLSYGQNTGATFTPQKTPVGRGLAVPFAFCIGGGYIYFVADDGIYFTDTNGPPISITETSLRPLFRGIAASVYNPINYSSPMRLGFANNELYFDYIDTQGNANTFIYSTIYQRWRAKNSAIAIDLTYLDENQSQETILYGGADGNIYKQVYTQILDEGNPYTVECRTGSYDMQVPNIIKEYGNVIIDANPQGNTITITPYYNAETQVGAPFTITGSGRQKFTASLQNTRAYSVAMDQTFSNSSSSSFGGIIYQMDILWRMEHPYIVHWQFITSHGLIGWQHIRDVYFSLLSNAPVVFNMSIDGGNFSDSYTIPSTNGQRLKQYVEMIPRKGKMFTYTLDSTSPFELFGNECEVRVKPWVTTLGYQQISPFSQVNPLQTGGVLQP